MFSERKNVSDFVKVFVHYPFNLLYYNQEKEIKKMGNRKYEITYLINGIIKNRITVVSKNETSAVASFKSVMELSGIPFTSYFITEITYFK